MLKKKKSPNKNLGSKGSQNNDWVKIISFSSFVTLERPLSGQVLEKVIFLVLYSAKIGLSEQILTVEWK